MKTNITYKKMIANLDKGIRSCAKAEDLDMDEVADAYGNIQTALRVLEKLDIPESCYVSRLFTGKLPKRLS